MGKPASIVPKEIVDPLVNNVMNAPEDEIVRYAAKNGGVLFSKDSDFRKVRLITDLMKEHYIGLFNYKTPR